MVLCVGVKIVLFGSCPFNGDTIFKAVTQEYLSSTKLNKFVHQQICPSDPALVQNYGTRPN